MDAHSDFLLIPHERIGALIGKAGTAKKKLERLTKTKLEIDSEEGEVEVIQKGSALEHYKAMRIVKAVGRGFSPEKAARLMNEDCLLEIIDVDEEIGGSSGNRQAKKGRVIGSHGRAREEIEKDTGANVSVYGKTISIIGTEEQIEKAKRAIEMLLHGASHSTVYGSLKRGFEHERFEL